MVMTRAEHAVEAGRILQELDELEQDAAQNTDGRGMSDYAAAYFARQVAVARVHATLASIP